MVAAMVADRLTSSGINYRPAMNQVNQAIKIPTGESAGECGSPTPQPISRACEPKLAMEAP